MHFVKFSMQMSDMSCSVKNWICEKYKTIVATCNFCFVTFFFSHSMPQESMLQLSRTESEFFKKKTKVFLERLGFMKNLRWAWQTTDSKRNFSFGSYIYLMPVTVLCTLFVVFDHLSFLSFSFCLMSFFPFYTGSAEARK